MGMGTSLTEEAKQVAQAFVAARRDKRGLPVYPGTAPSDMPGAYRIQNLAIGMDGRPIAGWKVGKINPPEDARLGANRLSGPIFVDSIVDARAGDVPAMPVFADGFAAAEAEFLLHVAPGWNGAVPADDAGVRALLDAVHVGIEIASSPYPGINADGPPVTASDFGNNHGLVIGPPLAGGQALDFDSILVRLEIDGEVAGENTTANMLDGPIGAVRFLLGNLNERGINCSEGTWVSTGAVTGVHPVKPGESVRAVFGDKGELGCTIVAARPD